MSARGSLMLLSWLACCVSALWSYCTNPSKELMMSPSNWNLKEYSFKSPDFLIVHSSSSIKLEYIGTSFSEWSVPEICSVLNKSLPETELRCRYPGIHIIKPIVKGPDLEEERYLLIGNHYNCFLWYFNVINFLHNSTQNLVIWAVDPENADPSELQWKADKPSVYSTLLSKVMAAMGLRPVIYTHLKMKTYFPNGEMVNGTWKINIPMTTDDTLMDIKGNLPVALGDCYVADFAFQLTFPLLTIPEISGFLPICSPHGSQFIEDWEACFPSAIVVVTDMETFQTNDSFRTWTRIRVPPNVLTDDERHSVSDVSLSQNRIFFLINGVLFMKTFNAFTRLGENDSLPNGGIIGITSRQWCLDNYLLKVKEERSNMAIWTRHEVYLEYNFLTFVKVMTTDKLRLHLGIAPSSTLTIHNVGYTGHPLEIAFLLEYCTTCTNDNQIFLVLFNEDTEHLICKDFILDIDVNSFFNLRFIYSAIPEMIVWDKHKIYYSYRNLRDTGVLQTPTEFGDLSKLSDNSIIDDVFIDHNGNILVKMENNIMFFSKANMKDAIKLYLWTNRTAKLSASMDMFGHVYLLHVSENGTIHPEDYPLKLEVQSLALQAKENCPYVLFESNISNALYYLDKGDMLSVRTEIIYPENTGLRIIVETYGQKILKEEKKTYYQTNQGYSNKTLVAKFSHKRNYEGVDDYFTLQNQDTGLIIAQIRPSEIGRTCPITRKVFQIAVGCDTAKYITVKGFKKAECLQHDLLYIIEKSYLRNQPHENLRVKYNWSDYGCPMKLGYREKFHPVLQLYNGSGYIEDINVNFIVWEIHGRNDYSFNNTMKKSGCVHEAQTWKSMTALHPHLPLDDAWGPHNYKHCFSYFIGKPGDLEQPYEIINKSNYNHLMWPVDHAGMYVFRVKILDPNYSFCNLTATFAIETTGMIPRPSGYLITAFLFPIMLIVFSVLIWSYFHFTKLYQQGLYHQHSNQRKEKEY